MKLKARALWIFLAAVTVTVASMLFFIQSRSFADILKRVGRRYLPIDLGVDGDFSELAVKLIPPGVVIKKPSVILRANNPVGLPAGTKIDAQYIDVTFQFFQLLTGAVTINAFAIHGASLELTLGADFFAKHAKQMQAVPKGLRMPSFPKGFSWDSLVHFNFRSVSLVDSQIDFKLPHEKIQLQAYAKEFTIGRSTVDSMPSYDLAIDFQKAMLDAPFLKHSLSQFQASVEVSSQGVSIRNLGMQDGELNFHTNGQIKGNILSPKNLKSELSYIVRGPVSVWLGADLLGRYIKLPTKTPIDGNVAIEGKMAADFMDFEKTFETNVSVQLEDARFGEWRSEKAEAKLEWKAPVAILDSAQFRVGDGMVRVGRLEYDVSKKNQRLDAKLNLDHADFRRLVGSALKAVYPLHMFISGSIDSTVDIGSEFSVDGALDLKVREFSFDNQKADIVKPMKVLVATPEVLLKGRFGIDGSGVEFEKIEATLPNSKLDLTGDVDVNDGFNLDIRGNVNAVDVGKLAAFDLLGEGALHWTITGKAPAIIFTFDTEMKNGGYLNLKLGTVKGRLIYNDGTDTISLQNLQATQGRTQLIANGTVSVGASEDVNISVQVPRGTIQDFSTVFANFLEKSVPWYPYDLSGQMSGVLKASGKTDLDKLSVEGDWDLENIDFHHEIFRAAKVHGGFRRGAYIAENIALRKKSGILRGNVVYGADDILRFDVKSDGMTTLDIDRLASLGIPYRAPLEIETSGVGKFGNLKSSFRLSVGDGMIKNYSVAKTDFSFSTDAGRLKGDLLAFAGKAKGHIDWGWERNSPSWIDLEANGFDYRPILIAFNAGMGDDTELLADLTGSAHLKFQTGHLSRLSGNVGLNAYTLRRRGYSLSLAKPVQIAIQNGNYDFDKLHVVGEGSDLEIRGRVRENAIDYKIRGMLNLGILEFLAEPIASVRGTAKVDAKIFGKADEPSFNATITTTGADLRLRDFEQPFEDLNFHADVENSLMKFTGLSSQFAGGTIKGYGTALLYTYKAPDLDFRFDLNNPKVKVYPVAYARTSGKMFLKGTDFPYKASGSLSIAEALINENFSLSEGSRILRSSKFLPQKRTGGVGEFQVFDLDIDLTADRNFLIHNDLFDAELKGNLKVINTIRTPRMLGGVTVLHGKLLFKDNYFTIQSGNIRFSNPSALDPEFDLIGQTEVKGYKVILVASGAVSDYKLKFESQPPLPQNDIVSLLTLGITSSDYRNIGRESRDAYSRDEMYGLIFSQSGVNRGLEKYGVKVRVDQSQAIVPENAFRAKSASELNENVSPKVVLQKELTTNLKAQVGSTVGVGENTERNASLEYSFRESASPIWRNMSVLGIYEDQTGPQLKQQRTSVGADLKFKIRFK